MQRTRRNFDQTAAHVLPLFRIGAECARLRRIPVAGARSAAGSALSAFPATRVTEETILSA
jgi:hypothetical protein